MFRLRRWWLLCGAVLVGVVALNGVADAKVRPAPRAVCVRGGAKARDAVSGRGLVCVQTKVRGLRWRFQPTAVTTTTTTTSPSTTTTSPSTTTTTVSGVVAPVLVSVSASDGVQITVAGMRPDTGVYSLQWVPYGQTFNTYQMARATSPSMSVPAGWFACNRTYTFRVFVMQAGWQLADGHQTQNVTPHSTPFDVVMPACPTPATPLTCATGGVCVVGDTGPGGGKVFYVQATGTFNCGATLASTCKYLEAAPTSGTAAWSDAFYAWSGNFDVEIGVDAQGTAIGTGLKNTLAMETDATRGANTAGTKTRDYRGPNSLTDWYLPSRDELNELCKYARTQTTGDTAVICADTGTLRAGFNDTTGFGLYWSSTEAGRIDGEGQQFGVPGAGDLAIGAQGGKTKTQATTINVRPVRAFG